MDAYSKSRVNRPHLSKITQRVVPFASPVVVTNSHVNADCSFSGFRNPSWRDQVDVHQSATTYAAGSNRSVDLGDAFGEVRARYTPAIYPDEYYIASGTFVLEGDSSFLSVPALPSVATDNVALTRFYQSCNDAINQASGMIFLAELGDTVRQLKHPLRTLLGLLKGREQRLLGRFNRIHKVTSKKKRKLLVRDFKNAAADTWLEVQFGLQPLASDISDVATYMQFRRFTQGDEYIKVRGVYRTLDRTVTTGVYDVITGVGPKYSTISTLRTKVRYKGEIKVSFPPAGVSYHDFKALGFSLRQFLPALWEATPWSFLADYFLHVGDLIDSFNVPREDIAWYNKTMRSSRETIRSHTGSSPDFVVGGFPATRYSVNSSSLAPMKIVATQFQRTGHAGIALPRPTIVVDLPSGFRIANMVALAASESRSRFNNSR